MYTLRKANASEADQIAAFQIAMAKETENLELDQPTVAAGVKAVFQDPARGIYYVAMHQEAIVGSLLTTFEWSDWRNGTVLWIQSVFVQVDHRGNGVFKTMYEALKQEATANPDIKGIRLYVDKTNSKASKVYDAVGMNGEHYQLYEWMKD